MTGTVVGETKRGAATLTLLLGLAGLAESVAKAGEAASAPVDLSANQILTWDHGGARWALLTGRASASQGQAGLRSERIAVRIAPGPRNGELTVEAVAQEYDPHASGAPKGRAAFRSGYGVRYQPRGGRIPLKVSSPPWGDPLVILLTGPPPVALADTPKTSGGTPKASSPPRALSPPHAANLPKGNAGGPLQVALGPPMEPERSDPKLKRTQVLGGIDFGGEDVPKADAPPAAVTPIDDTPPPGGDAPLSIEAEAPPADIPPSAGPEIAPPSRIDDAPPAAEIPEERPLDPIPGDTPALEPPADIPLRVDAAPGGAPAAPIRPESQRVIRILPRSGGTGVSGEVLDIAPDGTRTVIYQGGVNLIAKSIKKFGTVDISADQVVVWIKPSPNKRDSARVNENLDLELDDDQPVEVYMEGNVVFRQDEGKVDGKADQKVFRGERFYYEFQTERMAGWNAEIDLFVPEFISPLKMRADRIQQFRSAEGAPGAGIPLGNKIIRADQPETTGSRFANPGYLFSSRTVDLFQVEGTGPPPLGPDGKPDPEAAPDLTWRVDARRNKFYLGQVPILYWPRLLADASDLDPPLNSIQFRSNRVFGQQVLSDWNVFKLLGIRRPPAIGRWNLDIDYLSRRGLALGSELTWSGRELLPGFAGEYFGYFDIWGIKEGATDILGPGPAVITDNLAAALKVPPIQRDNVPAFQDFRGRVLFRHMQSFLPVNDDSLEDARLQVEFGYLSDRNFLEEYYKRIFDSGLDQSTLLYFVRQRQNWAFTALAEANLMYWQTETQWGPKVDYTRLGDSWLNNRLTYYGNSGVNYGNTHTALEVNNPDLFAIPGGGRAFLPYDPVSNTSGVFRAFRAYTSHEVDAPIDLGILRVTPYAQGQLVGWSNQLSGNSEGRAWGALGARLNISAWRAFPDVESELFNLHGLAHKINFSADYRSSFTNLGLENIAVQDDLDDNTYEYVRRYYDLNNYPSGILPPQLDPRLLTMRRQLSPITQTVDVQDRLDAVRLGLFQRVQTKRGPEGNRRVTDVVTLDLTSTYFPNADRDNFGKPFGLNQYDFNWYISDRTTVFSQGWFEFWDITGKRAPEVANDPSDGITVVTSGVSFMRPPRGNITLGYSFIDATSIQTSAVFATYSYWMSPKWYSVFSLSYDFRNSILLGTTFGVTRIGADYLTSVGLTVDPLRDNYTFAVEVAPRLSPNLRLGSGSSLGRIDPRFAPVE